MDSGASQSSFYLAQRVPETPLDGYPDGADSDDEEFAQAEADRETNGVADGEADGVADGEVDGVADGEVADGEVDGEVADGEVDGEVADGEVADGEVADGEVDGEVADANEPTDDMEGEEGESPYYMQLAQDTQPEPREAEAYDRFAVLSPHNTLTPYRSQPASANPPSAVASQLEAPAAAAAAAADARESWSSEPRSGEGAEPRMLTSRDRIRRSLAQQLVDSVRAEEARPEEGYDDDEGEESEEDSRQESKRARRG